MEKRANEFFEKLKAKLQKNDAIELRKNYFGGKYTTFIKPIINKVVKDFTVDNESCGNELFRIDFYSYLPTSHLSTKSIEASKLKLDNSCWCLDIAVEHENNHKTWLNEFYKLNSVVANLKVLCCYYNYDKNSMEEALKYAVAGIMENKKMPQIFKDNFVASDYLVIVGKSFVYDGRNKDKDNYSVIDGYIPYYKKSGQTEFVKKSEW